jgi:hypothetical protein
MKAPGHNIPYQERLNRGLIGTSFSFVKFGEVRCDNDSLWHTTWEWGSDNLGNVDIIFPLDGTAPINRVSSSDVADTGDIFVLGLDINGTWTQQTITLTGQTPKPLDTALWRHLTSYNLASATSPIIGNGFAGDIYFYNDASAVTTGVPDVDAEVLGYLTGMNNRTLQGYMTCPAGYTARIKTSTISLDTRIAASAQFRIFRREYGGLPQLIRTGSIATSGTGLFSREIKIAPVLNARADLIPQVLVDTNDTSVSVEFSMDLIKIGEENYS